MIRNLIKGKVQLKKVNGIFIAWIDHCTWRPLSQRALGRRDAHATRDTLDERAKIHEELIVPCAV
jgi:hypothetical protein